ncbi:MAG TPA: hypothetical protein VK471_13045 [Solirubrobacterales bacterium]|nr:hypothetical protein [Solirubrobacterales bacterium]
MKRKITVFAMLGLQALVVSAQAAPHYTPAPPPGSHRCLPHNLDYHASGVLVSASLTAEEHHRYSGTLEVKLAKANHRAPTGDQTFTLAAAKVKFHHGVDPASPAAGSGVKLHGKITKLAKHCPTEGFTPTITVKKVDISRAGHHKG